MRVKMYESIVGDEVYQVIERCTCASNCHRMDHLETILDYSGIEIKESMNIADVRPTVKVRMESIISFLPKILLICCVYSNCSKYYNALFVS